jgi:4-hydroxy-tetrahydrodipicolinate reductase
MIKLALLGATGRMGQRVISLLNTDERYHLTAAMTNRADPAFGGQITCRGETIDVGDELNADCDVLIDFSIAAGTMTHLDVCRSRGVAMVIGATGHSEDELSQIKTASGDIPILKATNFSVGVNLLLSIVGSVAKRLGDAYDIEIIEHHHNRKIDAPSGTAVSLLNEIVRSTDRDAQSDVVYGRSGETGVRPRRQIGVHAVRMGEIVGHHEICFSGPGETISLRHTAHSRDTFARGALEAAAWLNGRSPGLYSMGDVLGEA